MITQNVGDYFRTTIDFNCEAVKVNKKHLLKNVEDSDMISKRKVILNDT